MTAHSRGFTAPQLALIEHRAALVRAGGADLSGAGYGYPPLITLIALVLPASPLSLAIAACLFTSAVLGYVGRLLRHRVSAAGTAALLAPIVAVPAMWYAGSQFLGPVAALAFLAVALDGFIRFTARGHTQGGFTAGIALALSLCCDLGALMYALAMCAFAPLISHAKHRGSRYAATAVTAVLGFPVAAATGGWLFLVWRFSGTFPGSLSYEAGARLLSFPGGAAAALAAAARAVGWDLLHVPLYPAAAALLCYRRPRAVIGLVLPVAALAAALWLGFVYSQTAAYLMFTILGLITVSETAARRFELPLALVALAQLSLALTWPPASAHFADWARLVL